MQLLEVFCNELAKPSLIADFQDVNVFNVLNMLKHAKTSGPILHFRELCLVAVVVQAKIIGTIELFFFGGGAAKLFWTF